MVAQLSEVYCVCLDCDNGWHDPLRKDGLVLGENRAMEMKA